MDSTFNNIYTLKNVFVGHTINLEDCTWFDPWVIGLVCLKAIEYQNHSDKKIILPSRIDLLVYLKRMHFDSLFEKFTYGPFLERLKKIDITEKENLNIHEILHCEFRDAFEGRLSSNIRMMLRNFGLGSDDEYRATALIGELGNNVFDHNDGLWPTAIRGAIILAQHNPLSKRIEIVVADPGIGFKGSLKMADRFIKDDIEAIKLGLSGVTGRVGEPRGNGLRVVQNWTINKFDGILRIHSGNGLVVVEKNGQSAQVVFPILGTLASFVIQYK